MYIVRSGRGFIQRIHYDNMVKCRYTRSYVFVFPYGTLISSADGSCDKAESASISFGRLTASSWSSPSASLRSALLQGLERLVALSPLLTSYKIHNINATVSYNSVCIHMHVEQNNVFLDRGSDIHIHCMYIIMYIVRVF